MRKKIKHICQNCQLYDSTRGICRIVILDGTGERVNLPVDPEDKCFFEDELQATNSSGVSESFKPLEDVKQVKFWVEDKDGKKTDKNGVVRMEYPEGFFGKKPDANKRAD